MLLLLTNELFVKKSCIRFRGSLLVAQFIIFVQSHRNNFIHLRFLPVAHQDSQKQPSIGILIKIVLKICSKLTGERPFQSVISIKLLYNFIKVTLQGGCYRVNLLHIFRTHFYRNIYGGLLLESSMMKVLCQNSKRLLAVKDFCKRALSQRLAQVTVCRCFL